MVANNEKVKIKGWDMISMFKKEFFKIFLYRKLLD
jgi:hypothetical protein